nr:IMP dehydrogenase/GMP reductase, related [Medicago truncatula]
MCGKKRVYCHLPERVKWQFSFVHDIPKHPSDVAEIPKEMLAPVLIDPIAGFYLDWRQRCGRPWQHEPGYMAWYAKVTHRQIIPPDEGSPPRLANVEQIIEEEHGREIPDTLTIIRDVVQVADNVVAMQEEMTKEELVQEMIRIGSTGRPALTYRIVRHLRGQRHRRQQS